MPRILLVEDNELNRDVLARLLKRKGYEVLFAEDGQVAIDLALGEHPDLVLMDIGLPVKDGHEATRAIRAAETGRRMPIIALTAHAMASDRAKALEAGCDEYETKPIDFARLLDRIESMLRGHES